MKMKLNNGFYTALGTPLDEDGNLIEDSLRRHIEQQINAGASGLLLLGSMGIEAFVTNGAYQNTVRVGAEANGGRLPLFVGAMDTSISKVMEKVRLVENERIDGIVLTTPFYSTPKPAQVVNWYTSIADRSPFPVYLYDLAAVTKFKITRQIIDSIIHHGNIKGIKTADWELIHYIERTYPNDDFQCLYSGLDSFDYANMMGIRKNLDGMFSCTPKNGRKMYDCLSAGDYAGARRYLDNILLLRDTMLAQSSLMVAFSHAMALLGCPGRYHPDYSLPITEKEKETVENVMRTIGEID